MLTHSRQNEEYQEERYSKENPPKYAQFQEYRGEKNSFWPGFAEIVNPWTMICVGSGAVVAGTEIFFRRGH